MQIKHLNSYRLTHKDGSIENLNADSLMQALENMETTETKSPVIQTFMVREDIATVVDELPSDILFTAIAEDAVSGAIATPQSGKIHVGDSIALKAIPAEDYMFVSWSRNGEVISTEASFVYEMTALQENEDTCIFVAKFALAPVIWASQVSPSGATGAGCVAFPESGTEVANGTLGLIAVEGNGYVFDHWERNGESLGTNKILETTVAPLSEGENKAIYIAVFNAE